MREDISFFFFRERSGIRAAKCGPFPLGEENLEKDIPCLEKCDFPREGRKSKLLRKNNTFSKNLKGEPFVRTMMKKRTRGGGDHVVIRMERK